MNLAPFNNIIKKIFLINPQNEQSATRLRRLDETREIVLLERGEYISYANCGLPYHVGDVIKSRQALLVTTPEAMRMKYGVDVRTRCEAVAIDRENKRVTV